MIVKNMYFIHFQTLRENKQVSWHQDGTGNGKPSSDNFFLESCTFLQMYIQIDMHTWVHNACIHVYIDVNACINIYRSIYIYVEVWIVYVHAFMCIYMHAYVYIHTHNLLVLNAVLPRRRLKSDIGTEAEAGGLLQVQTSCTTQWVLGQWRLQDISKEKK